MAVLVGENVLSDQTQTTLAGEDLNAKMESVGFGKGYRYYALGLLTVVYVFNFIDRQIVVILQESIKQDLGLMDWQLGMLSGFAFAVFYVIMGIPIARIADKGSRRNVISVSLALWSVMTALCGFVGNFWQLLLARIGVGVGEAGCSPPAHSIISDMFPVQQRATALSTYNMGINFGVFIGFLAGGWINEYLGWRQAFIFVGIPGVLFAVFVRLTLKEPPRGMSEVKPVSTDAPDLSDVFKLLWNRVSFRHMAMAAGLHAFVSYGVGGWMAPFLQRVHELGSGETANWLAPVAALPAAVGAFMGGYYCDKYGKNDARMYIWIPACAILLALPFQLAVYFLDDYRVAMLVYAVPVLLNACYLGPMLAMTHGLVSLRMRAVSSSVLFLVLNFIGLGLGPLFTGILSDVFSASMGAGEGLRWALAIVTLANLWAAAHYIRAAKYLKADLAKAPI
ncbi:MAG: MFS family permease [Candidatus Azotimanducaceae bacterium]|jgi:MFS family permease